MELMFSHPDFEPVCNEYPVDPDRPPVNNLRGRMNRPLCRRARTRQLPTDPPPRTMYPITHEEYVSQFGPLPAGCPRIGPLSHSTLHPNVQKIDRNTAHALTTYHESGSLRGVVLLTPTVPFVNHTPRFLFHYAPPSAAQRVPARYILIERSYCKPFEINGRIIYVTVHRYPPIRSLPEDLPDIYVEIM